jgi:hypothetical protein
MKLNEKQLELILQDLYAVNPALRQHEAELENMIREIVELEPEIVFDENFRSQLRSKLMARAGQLTAAEAPSAWWQGFFSGRRSYVFASVLAVVVIIVGAGYFAKQSGIINLPGQSSLSFAFKKIALGENAFGPLGGATQASGKGGSATAPVVGLGGGGGMGSNGSGGSGQADTVIYPSVYLHYVYKGEPLDLKDSQIEVLRRMGFNDDVSSLRGLLKNFGFNLVDMNTFSSLKVQNINLIEDKDFGFAISSNVQDGSIFVSQNWYRWPQPYTACTAQDYVACQERFRMKISDILPDSEALKIAKDFVKARGIDTSSYGEPVITDTWRAEYEKTFDKSQFYFPEFANVIFPLKINGQSVYDESGSMTGLFVTIDNRQKRVSNINGLNSQSYQASNYTAETDSAKIIKLVEQGGYWGSPYAAMAKPSGSTGPIESMQNNEMKLEVGTPTKQYVLFASYPNGPVSYLLVPSLIFPVINAPIGASYYYYQKNIVVPLAKELLDQKLQPSPVAQ